ncbi:MAG: COX15/CtaA family protein [Betaproteobacteria bacterium]
MRLYRLLLPLALLLAFAVVGLGAYVRLSDAGLGCPDWPGCYGHLVGVPDQAHEQAAAAEAFPGKPVEAHKAWKEMVHRYFAGTLGLFILAIAILGWRHRKALGQSPALATALLLLVAFQAALGMWTVTLLLKPVIVSAHLLGGMTTLALLLWLNLPRRIAPSAVAGPGLRLWGMLALAAVVVQIALGGWVSSNYAAVVCPDFPTCQGTWLPEMDFANAFHLRRELGQTADGNLLSLAALTAIHWTHRLGALVVTAIAGGLGLFLARRPAWKRWGLLLLVLLAVQISLGIANVVLALPLGVAVAHNLGAAALLTALVALNSRLWRAAADTSHAPIPSPWVSA